MNLAEIYHREAVNLAEQADMAKVKFKSIDYKTLYGRAYELEKEAAFNMHTEAYDPLPKTMLLKSAAALAYKAGRLEDAENMIALCRSENPNGYVSDNLDELEALIKIQREENKEGNSLVVRGILTQANADEQEIKIRDINSRQIYSFIVPAKMFKLIVKSHWQDPVSAVGKLGSHGVFFLEKISPAA